MRQLAVLFILFCLSAHCHAQAPYLFVGTYFPKVLELNEQGQPQGLAVDIVNKICKQIQCKIKIEIVPLKRALYMAETGYADAVIGVYRTKQRAQSLNYSTFAFYQDPMVFYQLSSSDFQWDGKFSSLEQKRISLVRGWSYGEAFNQYKINLNITSVEDMQACFRQLLLNRVDLIATNIRSAQQTINALSIQDKVKPLDNVIVTNRGYFAFSKSKGERSVFQAFDKALSSMYVNGEIQALNHKYGLFFEND